MPCLRSAVRSLTRGSRLQVSRCRGTSIPPATKDPGETPPVSLPTGGGCRWFWRTAFQGVFALLLGLPGLLPCGVVQAAETAPEEIEFYESKIRPLLAERCGACHSGKTTNPKAGLRLDLPAGWLTGGTSGPAVVPGMPAKSLLLTAVRRLGPAMPPEGPPLTESQIADLTRWIERGAQAPERPVTGQATTGFDFQQARSWWSLQPVVAPVPTQPVGADPRSDLSPLDRLVQGGLQRAGLSLAPEADKPTLLRRATFVLTGLPPTAEELADFLADDSPEAWTRVVDRLLSSPQYGERWARHWLDVARYADTKDGVLMYGDNRIRPYAYTYRDYVVRAFNEDLPFDRFVHEQLAADQLQPAVEPWRLGALGFLTLGRMFDNNIHDVIDDRIDTVTRGLLGLTVACARCHDHKYDAITQADYYGLYGVFASSEVPLELPRIGGEEGQPGVSEFEAELAGKQQGVREFLDGQYKLLLETARARVGDYLVRVATTPPDPLETAIFFLSLAPEDLRPPVVARWRRYVAARAVPDDPVFSLWGRLLNLEEGALAAPGVVEEQLRQVGERPAGTQAGEVNPLVLAALQAAPPRTRAEVAQRYGDLLKRVWQEATAAVPAADAGAERVGDVAAPDQAQVALERGAREQLLEVLMSRESPAWFPRGQTRRHMSRTETDAFGGKVNELDVIAVKSAVAPPRAMVLHDTPELHDPRIFLRGNPARPGDGVPRRFLELLSPGGLKPFGRGGGRLDLAEAITHPENPLTARVLVNRIWMQLVGEPLVGSPSDFGTRSTPPVQRELLDYLASRLLRGGWSMKGLQREILLSATWRQSSADRLEARARDPENTLLWRMPRRRLDLESMRDTLLAVSGRLEQRVGGRPIDALNPLEARRTVYGLVDRQNVPGLFRAFDFASPDASAERRPQTTVPQQALFALNSPFLFEQCRAVARRLPSGPGVENDGWIRGLFDTVLRRAPDADELADARAFLEAPAEGGEPLPGQLSRHEQLVQVLLMSNELMFVD